MSEKWNLLYVYAQRHPQDLRDLVYSSIPQEEFNVRRMHYEKPEDEMCENMKWADVVFFAPGRSLPDHVIEQGKNVKLMQLWSSGFDKFNTEAASRAAIPVANNGGANRIAVAEHTILLILSVYKQLPAAHARCVEGRWQGNSHGMDMFLLYRKTLGLIGMGNIGREVARRAAAFGMRVIYYDINRATPEIEAECSAEYRLLEEVISSADVLSLHLHLNEETDQLIGADEIATMKKKAIIINVSRGQLIDTDALYEAIAEGRIWGAGFDVYAKEPTEPGDPLLNHPHVVCTPHMACTYDTHVMALEASMENLLRVKRGEKPNWVVNDLG